MRNMEYKMEIEMLLLLLLPSSSRKMQQLTRAMRTDVRRRHRARKKGIYAGGI